MKVVQLIVLQDTETSQGAFMALCDDGSIWDFCSETRPIPGTNGSTETRKIWKQFPGPAGVIE